MANEKLMVPAALGNFTISKLGETFGKSGVITDLAGAAIDFTTWIDLVGIVASTQSNINPDSQGAQQAAVVTGNADGTLNFEFLAAVAGELAVYGSYTLYVTGKANAVDANDQLIGTGQVNFIRVD